jgi:zinc transport system substrate-binding protein
MSSPSKPIDSEGQVKVLTTFYPLTYIASRIGGEHIEISQLIPNNTEVHSWQPATSDIVEAEEADIIFSNGMGLDHWLEDDIIPSIEIEGKLVIETTSDIEFNESKDMNGDHEHGNSDPHTWLSPYIARHQAEQIYHALVEFDEENEEIYKSNWMNLEDEFLELDQKYIELSEGDNNVIFTTHAAFGHLAERYGFKQHGVIGISADEQPSTSTISNLVEIMIEHDTYVLYVDPVYNRDYVNTLRSEIKIRTGEDIKVLNLYFMLGPIDGLDYIEQMEENLDNLKEGLM